MRAYALLLLAGLGSAGAQGLQVQVFDRLVSAQAAKSMYEAEMREPSVLKTSPPYAANTHERYKCGDQYAENYGHALFVPVQRVPDGARHAARVKADAGSGRRFRCSGDECLIIVESIDAGPAGERQFALCTIAEINRRIGAPSQCSAVLIEQDGAQWMRVEWRKSREVDSCTMAGFFSESGSFGAEYLITAKWSAKQVLGLLAAALRQAPMALELSIGENHLRGTSGNRVSPYLSPYRELVTLHSFASQPGPQTNRVSVELLVTVNRANPQSHDKFHLPTEPQRQVYLRGIKDLVRQTLERNCAQHSWLDEHTFECRN
jgi:hypothetical protein